MLKGQKKWKFFFYLNSINCMWETDLTGNLLPNLGAITYVNVFIKSGYTVMIALIESRKLNKIKKKIDERKK